MGTVQNGFDLSQYRGELQSENRIDIAVRVKKLTKMSEEVLRIEYTSCLDKRIRHTKDVSVTLKQIEKAEVAKTKTDKQKTDGEEVRDPNANYYMCIVIVCLGVLSDNAMLPEFSTSHKLIASYVLGMMTILLIKLS